MDSEEEKDKETPEEEEKDTPDQDSPEEQGDDGDDNADEEIKQDAPADALSKTPEELEEEESEREAEEGEHKPDDDQPEEKKVSKFRQILRRVNIYLLLFLLIIIIGAVITIVSYLNSQQEPPEPNIANQELTDEELRQLATKDVSVGDTSQTLTINGNAVIAGQTLMRGNLNVAGNLHTGGSIQAPSLTISGESNLGSTQINNLEVAQTAAIEGETTAGSLKVSGTSSFGGPMTASQITVTQLVMSGSGILQVPNHVQFTGPTPSRSINSTTLGSGGTASVNGSDTSGTVNINTGNNPKAGCFVEIKFKQPFSKQPRVIVTPIGSAAGSLNFYVNRSPVSFSICSTNAAQANKSFAFDFFVAG